MPISSANAAVLAMGKTVAPRHPIVRRRPRRQVDPTNAYGEGLARILTRTLQIKATAQVTQGPAQNIVLMVKKEAMLGFVTTGVALQGWNGTDWAKGTRYRSIRVIFPMYDTAFQFAALKALRSSRSTISPDCESAFVHGRVQGVPMSLRFSKSLASPPTLLRRIEQMASQMAGGKRDRPGEYRP